MGEKKANVVYEIGIDSSAHHLVMSPQPSRTRSNSCVLNVNNNYGS